MQDNYMVIFQTKQDHRWFNDEYYGPFTSRVAAEKWINQPDHSDLDPYREKFVIQYLKPIN